MITQVINGFKVTAGVMMLVAILTAPNNLIAQEPLMEFDGDAESRRSKFGSSEWPLSASMGTLLSAQAAASLSANPPYQALMAQSKQPKISIVQPIWGGILGSAVGLFGGGLVGVASVGQQGYDAYAGLVVGAIIGEGLVMPLGVHHGNRRRGKFELDLLTSFAVAGAGLLMVREFKSDGRILAFTAVFQIGATVAVERLTARRK